MKKFSFKKPDISFPKVKMPWFNSKSGEKEVEQPSEADKPEEGTATNIEPDTEPEPEESTVVKSAFVTPKVSWPWKKAEPATEGSKSEHPPKEAKPAAAKPVSNQEVAQLRRQLTLWRWVAASCAFAALSAFLLLG